MSASTPPRPSEPSFLPAPRQPVDDWTVLKGQLIEVHVNGRLIDKGWVDDVMADGTLLWLMHCGASGRRIIENLPGTHVFLNIGDNGPLAAL